MLDDEALDLLFRNARTHRRFFDEPVTDAQLRRMHEILKWGPTSVNCQPMRVVFVRSKEAKERLKPALDAGNRDKTMRAPVTAIIAHDTLFYEHLPKLLPHSPNVIDSFRGAEKKALAEETAFRNGTLQGAYLILAARAVGLDCGPMSGFDNAKVDAAFFPDGRVKSNFLCNLGRGDPAGVSARSPRFAFEDVCTIL